MPAQQEVLQLYRDILKAAKRFPSIKRNQILADIKTEFHANKVSIYSSSAWCWCQMHVPLTYAYQTVVQVMHDETEITKARQVAVSSLHQLHDYVGLGGSSKDSEVQLRGTTPL